MLDDDNLDEDLSEGVSFRLGRHNGPECSPYKPRRQHSPPLLQFYVVEEAQHLPAGTSAWPELPRPAGRLAGLLRFGRRKLSAHPLAPTGPHGQHAIEARPTVPSPQLPVAALGDTTPPPPAWATQGDGHYGVWLESAPYARAGSRRSSISGISICSSGAGTVYTAPAQPEPPMASAPRSTSCPLLPHAEPPSPCSTSGSDTVNQLMLQAEPLSPTNLPHLLSGDAGHMPCPWPPAAEPPVLRLSGAAVKPEQQKRQQEPQGGAGRAAPFADAGKVECNPLCKGEQAALLRWGCCCTQQVASLSMLPCTAEICGLQAYMALSA